MNLLLDRASLSKTEEKGQSQRDSNTFSTLQRPLASPITRSKKLQGNGTISQRELKRQQFFSRRVVLIGGGAGVAALIVGTLAWQALPQWFTFFSRSFSAFFAIPRTTSSPNPSPTSSPSPTPTPSPPYSPSPAPTTQDRLEATPHIFHLTVDVNGLLNDLPQTISDIKHQVRAQTFFQNRIVAYISVYGGAPTDNDIAQAINLVDKVYSVLRMLGQEGFAFQRSVYNQPEYILGAPLSDVQINVYLFVN